ncbi:uncharacterized protein LOC136070178 isoform X2 [Quercus suber]|uniref:uncharacterized protein LOC136070178 isoform X2 n=1 Tax=Quercus suber TaxID=58331 RepID=UPI0032E0027D
MLEESESEDEPEPLSIYRPTIELSVPMGTPIEGLFGRVKFATLAPFAATRGVFAEATTSPIGPVPIDEGTHIGKRSEEILEDPEDEPILGRRISESEEEERAPPEIEFMETFEGLGIATDIGVFAAITHAASSVPVSVVPSVPASVFPSAPITASSDKFSSSFTSSPLKWSVTLPPFQILRARLQPSLHASTNLKSMISDLQISGVPDLLT